MTEKELVIYQFTTWEDAFQNFRGYKNVDKMKEAAKRHFIEHGAVMIYNPGFMGPIFTRMDVPKEELEKL